MNRNRLETAVFGSVCTSPGAIAWIRSLPDPVLRDLLRTRATKSVFAISETDLRKVDLARLRPAQIKGR
jgi:hypothetical protein